MIYVSTDQGEEWNMAQLPPVGHEQFYSILAANDEMVFMHVDEPGGEILVYFLAWQITYGLLIYFWHFHLHNTYESKCSVFCCKIA